MRQRSLIDKESSMFLVKRFFYYIAAFTEPICRNFRERPWIQCRVIHATSLKNEDTVMGTSADRVT